MSYQIQPFKGQKTYSFADTLPAHPCRMMLVGASQLSGKSTVLFNLLSKQFPYYKFYKPENIYIICPTFSLDNRWEKFKIPTENISEHWDPSFIDEIKENVQDKQFPSLLICDDIVPLPSGRQHEFHSVFTRGRHWGENKRNGGGLAIWVTSQNYKALKPVVRNNVSNLCVWLTSDVQTHLIYEEHSNGLKKNVWMEIFKYCTNRAHSFLHINYANHELKINRFCLKFEKTLSFE